MTTKRSGTRAFFLLTFLLTWGLQAPGVLAHVGLFPERDLYLALAGVGIFGPTAAALIVNRLEGGAASVLFRPLLRWRVFAGWYLVALLPALALASLLFLLNLAGRHGPIAYVPSAAGLVFGLVVSTAEEIGWRGFALPRLQRRFGSFAASGLLGVVWYVWHIPMFIGQNVPLNLFLVMLLYFVGASLMLTWIYDGTGGSLLLVTLAHLAAHLNNSHRALPGEILPLVVHAIVYAGIGLLVMRAISGLGLPRATSSRLEP